MFEDSLLESGGRIKSTTMYWIWATGAFWAVILIALILIPLMFPEALPKNMMVASLSAPPPPPPPPPQAIKPIPVVSEIDQGLHAPTKIPKDIKEVKDDAPPPSAMAGVMGMGMGGPGGVAGGVMGGLGSAPVVVKAAPVKPAGPQRISSGVINGLAISQPQPVYPPIARAAHVQGTVVLRAIISKTGTIEKLQVVSGPPMLTQSAMDAVARWRYKPFLLSGEPTEVDTTINVNFTFGG